MQRLTHTTNAFVAMFDFLGFKQLRKQEGTAGLYKLYRESLLPYIQQAAARKQKIVEATGGYVAKPDFGEHSVEYRMYSDSVVFFTAGDSFEDFSKIADAAYALLCFGFAGHRCPVRGAIGHGDAIGGDDTVWIGSAIEDAAQGEQSQIWSGCVLTKSCESFCIDNGYIEQYRSFFDSAANSEADRNRKAQLIKMANRFVHYPDIPIRTMNKQGSLEYGTIEGIALNWPITVTETAAESAFRDSSDNHARKIQENTMAFRQWVKDSSGGRKPAPW